MNNGTLFETVLASTVHDMKNSLSLLLGQLDSLTEKLQDDDESTLAISTLRYETSRVNLSLMQLLTLYKVDHGQFSVRKVEVEVIEFLEDCIASHEQLAKMKNIHLQMNCDDDLIWFFDPDLIGIAINNVIGNSIRYTKAKVCLTARVLQGQLNIEITDDGNGYPEEMLASPEDFINRISYRTGSTGLGLFFAAVVSENHQKDDLKGHIQLDNKAPQGGGRFQIYIP
ncbi:MAG TPA: HAMP domain-containing histidine kinase [Aeromonadales bacterium]|nr:HAMP domain-containing histidine kinase [Aeromonadales bacterium]